jgi:hypothetical protein
MMAKKKNTGISIADIERAMGQKADEISAPQFDPEMMGWSRTITFNLKPKPKRALKGNGEGRSTDEAERSTPERQGGPSGAGSDEGGGDEFLGDFAPPQALSVAEMLQRAAGGQPGQPRPGSGPDHPSSDSE